MAGPAGGLQVEAGDGIAAGDHAAVGAGRFRDQHVFVAGGLGFDQVAGGRAADFLVAGEQHGDRQPGAQAGALQLADRFQRQVVAALHVQDARPPGAVALAPERQFRQRADRVHGVEVAHHQDARHIRRGVREGGADAIAEAHAAGDPLDPGAGQDQGARGDVHHAVDRGGIEGRAFALDPLAQPGEHGVGIEGQGVRVHSGALLMV